MARIYRVNYVVRQSTSDLGSLRSSSASGDGQTVGDVRTEWTKGWHPMLSGSLLTRSFSSAHALCLFFLYFLGCSLVSPALGGDFSWKDCGGSRKKIVFDSFDVQPDPIKFSSKASVSGKLRVLSSVESLSVSTELGKKVLFFWLSQMKDCPDYIGTCQNMDYCALVAEKPALCKGGLPCACPIKAQEYQFSSSLDLPENNYGSLATGSFYYKALLKEGETGIGCLEVYFDVEDARRKASSKMQQRSRQRHK